MRYWELLRVASAAGLLGLAGISSSALAQSTPPDNYWHGAGEAIGPATPDFPPGAYSGRYPVNGAYYRPNYAYTPDTMSATPRPYYWQGAPAADGPG